MAEKRKNLLLFLKLAMTIFIAVFVILCATGDLGALEQTPSTAEEHEAQCQCNGQEASTAAIRAPLLTIGSVLILLIRTITIPNHWLSDRINAAVIPASVIVGAVAGWHWLAAETKNP